MSYTTTTNSTTQTATDDVKTFDRTLGDQTPDKAGTTSKTSAQRKRTMHSLEHGKKSLAKVIGQYGTCTENLKPEDLAKFLDSKEKLVEGLSANTWKNLYETKGMTIEDKRHLITDADLLVAADMASDKLDLRIFDRAGDEYTHKALRFALSREGLDACLNTMVEFAVLYEKKQIFFVVEPTGHYWFTTYEYMTSSNITVLLVNPYAVNRMKEVDTNEQSKTDEKDPHIIGKLARDAAFSVPYLPEKKMAELRNWAHIRERETLEHGRCVNRLLGWEDKYFPELRKLYTDSTPSGVLTILRKGLMPEDIVKMGTEGILEIFVTEKFRGKRQEKAAQIYAAASKSIGLTHGLEAARCEVKYLVEDIRLHEERIAECEKKLLEVGRELYPNLEKATQIAGVTEHTLLLCLADIGDLCRFHDVAEIIKLGGLVPVEQSSGKWKGQSKISKRGRKRIRAHLYTMAENVVKYDPGFMSIYERLTHREDNPLTRNKALMSVAAKLLKVILHLLKSGEDYDPEKLAGDIKYSVPPKKIA